MSGLTELVLRHGLWFLFANVLVEQVGLPVPAVPALIAAGAIARDRHLPLLPALTVAVLASLAADALWFLLGRRHGYAVLRTLCKVSLSPDSCVKQTEAMFDRWGLASLLFAKFVPGFSTVAPPHAGAVRTRMVPFLLYDAGGAFLWAGSALLLGVLFHRTIDRVFAFLSGIGTGALYLVLASFAAFAAVKWWQRQRFYRYLRMARIRVDELRRLIDDGTAPVVVDVRSEPARRRDGRKIPGAVPIDLAALEAADPGLPREREIILYCT